MKRLFLALVSATAFTCAFVSAASSMRADQHVGLPESTGDARVRISASIGNDSYAHLWASASSSGGRCFFVTFDHRRAAPAASGVLDGRPCTAPNPLGPDAKHRIAYSINGPDPIGTIPPGGLGYQSGEAARVVYGQLTALVPVSSVIARGPGKSVRLAIRGGWVLGVVPLRADYKGWRLIAYANDGRIAGRVYL